MDANNKFKKYEMYTGKAKNWVEFTYLS
jgi:hypothetical protein